MRNNKEELDFRLRDDADRATKARCQQHTTARVFMDSDSVIDDGRHGRLDPRRRKSRFI